MSSLVEGLVGPGRKSLQAPGQRREKSSPGGLAVRELSRPVPQRNEGSPNTVGVAIITMVHLRVSLPHDLGARILGNQEMPSLVALIVVLVATAASALPAESHEWYA